MEVEKMINKMREQKGRPFDVKELSTLCVANVIMSMLFGHRFEHSDPSFQQLLSDVKEFLASVSQSVEIFPVLRFLPNFKKTLNKSRNANESVLRFVNSNIATVTQVCNYT